MISTKRRVFLKGTLAAGTVGVAVGAGLLAPSKLLAAWPSEEDDARVSSCKGWAGPCVS